MEVSPKVLEFKAPFTEQSTCVIKVTNTSADAGLAFKVKTTAPKVYCVKPNAAFLLPNQSIDVSIVFQGLSKEPSIGTKCKDRFLIVGYQSDTTFDSKLVSSNWADIQENAVGSKSEIKLKVSYNFDNSTLSIPENDVYSENNSSPIINKSTIEKDSELNKATTTTNNNTTNEESITSDSIKEAKESTPLSSKKSDTVIKQGDEGSSLKFTILSILIALIAYYIYKTYI